jgi:hypothetical protein
VLKTEDLILKRAILKRAIRVIPIQTRDSSNIQTRDKLDADLKKKNETFRKMTDHIFQSKSFFGVG